MANLTRRQKMRLRTYVVIGLVALAALVLLGIVLGVALRGIGSVKQGPAISQEYRPAATPRPVPTDDPKPTPEPTPAPPAADLDSWELRLVCLDSPLPEDFEPELMEIERGEKFDVRAGEYLLELIEAARAEGYTVYVCSCYRPYQTQSWIYWNHVNEFMRQGMTQEQAEAATRVSVNYPGASEHQLGLAADLLEYENQPMEPYIAGSGLMLWLERHCAEYGFIIRYPQGRSNITGVEYEPWHLRYVGDCAPYIMENDLCLEEFLALYE